jgi:Arc/MetJ-type ribon-helix-helix transcriptional regulator
MTQLVARVDEEFIKAIDELIADGVVASRSEAVRRGLQVLIDQSRRHRTADAIVRGYRAKPQTEDEWGWADGATVRMIGEEPW